MTAEPAHLTFVPTQWNQPKTITVTGVDDYIIDGDHTTTVILSIDDAQSDDHFDALADEMVSVTTRDDGYHGWQNKRNRFDVNGSDGVTGAKHRSAEEDGFISSR